MKPFIADKLPLQDLDWKRLVPHIAKANRAVAAFDGLLHGIPSADILVSPMITQEAVLSSRIEGTQADVGEFFRFEAGLEEGGETRQADMREISNYRSALRRAEVLLETKPFCINTLLDLHSILLNSVRGFDKARGQFRRFQNHIGPPGSTIESAYFVPPTPETVLELMQNWESYYHADETDSLVQLAVIHAQFEIIHPFLDGNGRIGRMLVPLFLFEKSLLHRPCFYVSDYLEAHEDAYRQTLRSIGTYPGSWTAWIEFFLKALTAQGEVNAAKVKAIYSLYERLKKKVLEVTHSRHAIPVLDFIFSHPVFLSSHMTGAEGMPARPTVMSILDRLKKEDILTIAREARGRQAQILYQRDLFDLCDQRGSFNTVTPE